MKQPCKKCRLLVPITKKKNEREYYCQHIYNFKRIMNIEINNCDNKYFQEGRTELFDI